MANKLGKWLSERKDRIEEEVKKGQERKGLAELPDGTYIAVYKVHEFGESSNENIGLKSCLKVLEGEQAGEEIWIWEDLDRENAFEWLVVRLKNSGVEVEDASDIYDQLSKNPSDVFDLVKTKTVVKVSLRTKEAKDGNRYQNKNVTKFLPDYEFDEDMLNENSSKNGGYNDEKAEEEGDDKYDPFDETLDEETLDSSSNQDEDGDEDEEDEEELAVGMRVRFKKGKKELEGEVVSLNVEEETATVKTAQGVMHEVGSDAILAVLENESV